VDKPIRGTDIARAAGCGDHADAIEAMLQQLLIALVKRAGGTLEVPVAEIDDTGGDLLAFRVDYDTRVFHFEVQKKQ
jgi:delta 1-pyrroline-5-carboxylate dehydrogenase